MPRHLVAPLAAGALLQLGCGGREPPRVPNANPPAPEAPPVDAPGERDPAPERAPDRTNPPIPSLVVTDAGTCHPGNGPRGQAHADWTRVTGLDATTYATKACEGSWCGEAVPCPEGVLERVAAWKAENGVK